MNACFENKLSYFSRLTALFNDDSTGVSNLIGETVDIVERMPSPRFIRSYLPKELLPTQLESVKPKVRKIVINLWIPKTLLAKLLLFKIGLFFTSFVCEILM